jgi:glucoamylase
MVGCALGISRLWFTLGFGIVNEVYYPRVDIPQIRDLGFIIADGERFWAEVKRIANYRLRLLAPGVPAVEVVHEHERYALRLRIAPSVRRDVLAIECRLDGDPRLRVYALLAPHLGATGYGNRAEVVMRSTKSSATRSAGRAPVMSAAAMVGRISTRTAK